MNKSYLTNGKQLSFEKAQVMAIINLTPDSFYDGGKFSSLTDIINDAEMKIRIFGLPRKLSNEQRILIDELGRFFEMIIKKIIRELMLFDISDLMYATVIDIENLNLSIPEITERDKEKLLELRSLEFKKYLRRKLFKDYRSNITEKDFYIDKIILKISDVYALMNASNEKIDELHLGNLKNAKDILKNLRDILKANSSNTNSSNTNSSNTNSSNTNSVVG
jgi:hypothetical protein